MTTLATQLIAWCEKRREGYLTEAKEYSKAFRFTMADQAQRLAAEARAFKITIQFYDEIPNDDDEPDEKEVPEIDPIPEEKPDEEAKEPDAPYRRAA